MPVFHNAFITGASSGLGQAIALELARRGTRAVLAARRVEKLEELALRISGTGARADVCELDVRDTGAVRESMRRWDREVGGFDLVIANAGIGKSVDTEKLQWEDVEEMIDVNVKGAIVTLIEGLQLMLPRRRGTLVGMSSLAGVRAMPRSGVYAASKAALQSFVETLEIDLARTGLKVIDIQPGFVRTPMTDANTSSMPFLVEVEVAARRCVDGMENGSSVISFPWQLALPLRTLGRIMPRPLWRWVARRAKG